VRAGTTKGLFRVPKRPRPLLAGDDLSLRPLGHLASLNSVRIRTELAIVMSRAYVRVIIDREAPGPQASMAESPLASTAFSYPTLPSGCEFLRCISCWRGEPGSALPVRHAGE
jgi:hypothetical protein